MCGVCGIWHFNPDRPVDPDLLVRMTRRIRHRGPDEEGIHCEGPVGLGFRRLSILDLAASHQPMRTADGSHWIVFNGEIYNFQDLRPALAANHPFRTTGDTEVLLHGLAEHGPDFLQQLRGMFAFALWDTRRREMTLAVDRFGKKPLYYALDSGRLVFGSELKVLLEVPDLALDPDPEALDEYLCGGFIAAPRSIYRQIRKLPPGCRLTVSASGQSRIERYWTPVLRPESGWRSDPPETLARELRSDLEAAVRLRMISDVPLGAFLSGGLDSSAVVALMSRMTSHRLKTFSIGFAGDPDDESPYSALMARHVGSDHTHEVVSAQQLAEIAPELATHFDEPFADDSMVPTWFVSRLARRSVTVALSGDGGDEVFGGYTWYRRAWRQARLQSAVPGFLRSPSAALGSLLPRRYGQYLRQLDGAPADWRTRAPGFDRAARVRLYRPEFLQTLGDYDADRERLALASDASLPLLSRLQNLDIGGYLPGDILVKVDRVSMRESLEVRSPLLDHRVFEFMAAVPPSLKLNGRGSKWLLQEAVRDLLPSAILHRRKRGFDAPLTAWFQGPLRPLVEDLASSRSLHLHAWLDPDAVRQVLHPAPGAAAAPASRIWTLICLELWCRQSLSRPAR
ncbi:MAG: asparagine synthase (glutamine-hydrolyzing) [Verrucomicrobiae bacterium]|nr:asparagine synthase (glutamine-hydrolyzing) [Verrucomicrobiae bacterium]